MFNFFKKFKKEKQIDPEFQRLSNHIDMIVSEKIICDLIEEAKQKSCDYIEFLLFLRKDKYDKPAYTFNRLNTTLIEGNKIYLANDDSETYNPGTYLTAYTTINVSSKMFENRSEWAYDTNLVKTGSKIVKEKYKNSEIFFDIDWDIDADEENVDYLLEALELKDLKSDFYCPKEDLFIIPCISITFQPNNKNRW